MRELLYLDTSDTDGTIAHDPEDQQHFSEDEQYREDIDEHTLDRPLKRTRTNKSKRQAPRKKYIKGKQGGLQGIMMMPLEVFMEVRSSPLLLNSYQFGHEYR